MAIRPNQSSPQDNESSRDWEKLSPAVKPMNPSGPKTQKVPIEPFRSRSVPAADGSTPWTSTIQRVAMPPDPAAMRLEPAAPPVGSPHSPHTESLAEVAPEAIEDSRPKRRSTVHANVNQQSKPFLLSVRCIIIALAVPVVTFMLAVRIIASPAFLWAEYNRPGFPADSYGFDATERMRLGSYGLDYILNFAPESYLADIHVDGVAVFLPAEVEHMTDVKRLILYSMVFAAAVLLLALLAAFTLPTRAPGAVSSSLFTGSWLTLIILMLLGVSGLLGWDAFFTTFHEVFFPQGNWQFRMSDTLIRLYPPRFWVDAALAACAIVVLVAGNILICTWPTARRQEIFKQRAAKYEAQES